jgi:C4-dicarboxylate transporter/malic acid transport protein
MSTTTLAPTSDDTRSASGLVRGFHPGWFGAVMGTGIVGVAAYLNPGSTDDLYRTAHGVGVSFVLLAWLEAVLLAGPYLFRMARHPDASMADLRHPVIGPLYGTFPAALLVLAAATATVGGSMSSVLSAHDIVVIVAVLASAGSVLTFVFGVVFAYVLFAREDVGLFDANGGWSIPPVANMVIPLPLLVLIPHVDQPSARLLYLAGYATLGMGTVLFLFVTATLFDRLFFHPLPHASLAPSLWIGLGPIGVGSFVLLRLAAAGQPFWGPQAATVMSLSRLGATFLWGFGLWWLAIAGAILVRYFRHGGLPFGIGLWAFTFPMGAYTVATLQVARSWQSHPLEWGALGLFGLLACFWLAVGTSTLVGIGTGKAWKR